MACWAEISNQLLLWSSGKKCLGKVPYGSLPAGLFLMYLCLSCQERVKPRVVTLTAKSLIVDTVPQNFLDLDFCSFHPREIISSRC